MIYKLVVIVVLLVCMSVHLCIVVLLVRMSVHLCMVVLVVDLEYSTLYIPWISPSWAPIQ